MKLSHYMTLSEIRQMVMDRFPIIPEEINCALERGLRNEARNSYKMNLMIANERLLETMGTQQAETGKTLSESI